MCFQPCKHYDNYNKNQNQGNGKREVKHTTADPHDQHIVVTANDTFLRFLVDSGAQVSVIPSSWLGRRSGPSDQHLQAENGTSIATYGMRNVLFHLGSHRYYARLVISDVKRPLLGADFLRQYKLLVDAVANAWSKQIRIYLFLVK